MKGIPKQLRRTTLSWLLAILIVFSVLPIIPIPAQSASAQVLRPGISTVVSVLGIFRGIRARNRVYREANQFIGDRRAYYDKLRETALEQLKNRNIAGLRDSQVAAYVKLVVMIERERTAMIELAESEKRAARAQFHDRVENAIIFRVKATLPAQRLFDTLSQGINAADNAIEIALSKIAEGGEVLTEMEKVRGIAGDINRLGTAIGGRAGAQIRRAATRVVNAMDVVVEDVRTGLEDAQGEIAQLGEAIDAEKQAGRVPNFSQVTSAVSIGLLDQEDDPAMNAIIDVIAGKASQEQTGIRELARAQIFGGYLARCAYIGAEYRRAVARLRGEEAPQLTDDEAAAPCFAIDPEDLEEQVVEGEATDPEAEPEATATDAPEVVDDVVATLELVSLQARDGWCFPKLEFHTTTICGYEFQWVVAYATPPPGGFIECTLQKVDLYERVYQHGTKIDEIAGEWSFTEQGGGGHYPDLGEYIETFRCDLLVPDRDGTVVATVQADLLVPLTTLRTE